MGMEGMALALGALGIFGTLALLFARTGALQPPGKSSAVTVADGNERGRQGEGAIKGGETGEEDAEEMLYRAGNVATASLEDEPLPAIEGHASRAAPLAWAVELWGRVAGGGRPNERVRVHRGKNPKLSVPMSDPDEAIDGELD